MTSYWQQVLSYKYQYQYQRSKYQYKYQYLKIVLKYGSSTSTQYNKTGNYRSGRPNHTFSYHAQGSAIGLCHMYDTCTVPLCGISSVCLSHAVSHCQNSFNTR